MQKSKKLLFVDISFVVPFLKNKRKTNSLMEKYTKHF